MLPDTSNVQRLYGSVSAEREQFWQRRPEISDIVCRKEDEVPALRPLKRRIGSTESGPAPDARCKERSKVSRACDACKSKKTRCSGDHPCLRCQQNVLTCTYLASYTRGRPPLVQSPPQQPELGAQLSPQWIPSGLAVVQQETAHNQRPDRGGTKSTADASSRNSPVPSTDIAGQYHGPSSPITFLDRAWKRLRKSHLSASLRNVPHDAVIEGSSWTIEDVDARRTLGNIFDILPEQEALLLVEKYFQVSTPLFHFLHQGSVKEWVTTLYRSRIDGISYLQSLKHGNITILLMIFAAATFDPTAYAPNTGQLPNCLNTELFLGAAQGFLQDDSRHVSLESIQARLIECLYLLSTSQAPEAYIKFGTVASSIVTLGLHRRQRSGRYKLERGYIDQECQKRTFWAAYTVDRYLSIMGGRPRVFQDFDINQDLPERVDDMDLTETGITPRQKPFDCVMDAPLMHLSLARIMGQTSRSLYPLHDLTQDEIIRKAQRTTENLAAWMAQLPPFLHLVPPSSLIPTYQRQSIVLRLAHSHALIQAGRPCLLNNFASYQYHNSQPDQSAQKLIHGCINSACDTVRTLLSFNGGGVPFYSSWFTQYVSFSAVAVLYIHTLQQRQVHVSMPSSTSSMNESQVESEDRRIIKENFELAERCQRLLAAAARDSSPGKRYDVILEELRQEVYKHMQTVDMGEGDAAPINELYETPQSLQILDDDARFIADFEADIFNVFGDWGMTE